MLARILKIQSKPPQNLICSLDLTQVPLYVTPTLQVKVVVSVVCCCVIYYPKLSDLWVFSRFWRIAIKFFLGIHQATWAKSWGSSEASLCKLWHLRCWVFFLLLQLLWMTGLGFLTAWQNQRSPTFYTLVGLPQSEHWLLRAYPQKLLSSACPYSLGWWIIAHLEFKSMEVQASPPLGEGEAYSAG